MIQFINPKDLYEIRMKVLRKPHHTVDTVMFDDDFHIGSFHLAAMNGDDIIGCISFSKCEFQYEKSVKNCFQLRGMAVDNSFASKGIGRALYEFGEKIMLLQHADLVWCNARTGAVGFYEKLGFETFGEEFIIEIAGPHFVKAKKFH